MALDPWLAELLAELAPAWLAVPAGFAEAAASLAELGVRTHTGATVLAVERGGVVESNPPPWYALRAEDRLLVLGTASSQARLRELLAARTAGARS
jgi:K+/H+ antiporter YhaU regulatory subunit KhtT